jgi:adenine deaminase
VEQTAAEIQEMHRVLAEMGCTLEYPLWTFVFLSFTSVLGLRLTYSGVFDVKTGEIVFS